MVKRVLGVVRFAHDHPILSAIALSFGAMSLVVGIEWLEKGRSIVWLNQHRAAVALAKQGLCLISIPGFLVLMFWREGADKKGEAPRVPSWVLPAVGVFTAVCIFYYALKVFLAAR